MTGAALAGAGFLLFTKKGQEIQDEVKKKLPDIKKEIKTRYDKGRKTMDEVIDEVVDEWKGAQKIMDESVAPIKKEIKKRMKK